MSSPLESFVRGERIGGVAGDLADSGFTDKITLTNDAPRAKQVSTITVSGATNDKVYTITLDGIAISYTADGTATIAEVAIGLRDAVNAEQLVNGRVIATSTATETVLTARVGGAGFVVTEADAELSIAATTANATADTVPFGRLVLHGALSAGSNKLGILADGSKLTAQVQSLLLVYDAAAIAKVGVKVYDPATGAVSSYEVEHVMATDADTSVIALAALLETALPANTVSVGHTVTDTLDFTAEVAGVTFELSYGFGTGADTGTWTHTIDVAGSDVNSGGAGVSLRDHSQELDIDVDTAEYAASEAMSILRRGRVFVDVEADLTSIADGVFVRLTANGALDALGGFAPAAGAGLVKLDGVKWSRQVSAGLAILEVNL